MSAQPDHELLPLLGDEIPHFDVVFPRGYDRRQVSDYVERAEAEIANLTAQRDAAVAANAEITNRYAHAGASCCVPVFYNYTK